MMNECFTYDNNNNKRKKKEEENPIVGNLSPVGFVFLRPKPTPTRPHGVAVPLLF